MRPPTLRREPRFSANKLAEYLSAGPTKRRGLIIDQIVAPATKVLSYEYARVATRRILANPERSVQTWIEEASRLRDQAALNSDEFDARCLRLSAQALEAFAPNSNLIRTKGAVAVSTRRQLGALSLSGVSVSVTPETSLIEVGSECRVGAIKFHFAKAALRTEGLLYVAAMTHQVLLQSGETPRGALCIAVDAFAGNVVEAPRAMKTRIRDLASACEEIRERWPALHLEQVEKLAQRAEQ